MNALSQGNTSLKKTPLDTVYSKALEPQFTMQLPTLLSIMTLLVVAAASATPQNLVALLKGIKWVGKVMKGQDEE
ncbi:hypothetical protein BUE80_DR000858 [Diplocarpon rosae]|nr:hypothetical protein BUE80_DR000858 [Diplocarpon rosae]